MPAFRPLASTFPAARFEDWRALAVRGAGGLDRLVSASMDGIPVGPLYPPAAGPVLAMRPSGAPWTVVQRIDRGGAKDIATEASAAVRGGATGLELVFRGAAATHGRGGIDPGVALDGALAAGPWICRLDAGEATARLALRHIGSGSPVVSALDPLATMAVQGGLSRPIEEIARDIAALADAMDRDGRAGIAFVADGRPWHDGGASEVQELAAVAASAVASLRLLDAIGVPPARAWRRLGVTLSADADQFLTIARFRAIRLLLARLAEVLGVGPARPPVHAETAWRMMSGRDPTMNMVRATTVVFAAAVGGADSVTVLPPLFREAPFSARMARNTQTILLEESSLYREDDPGAGAGAVEALTDRLAAAAWDQFARIEREGGLPAALRSGSIQRAVAAMRDARLEKIARREMPLVGVNVYVDRDAPVADAAPPMDANGSSAIERLRPTRLAEPLERLARRSLAADGNRRAVLLVGPERGEDPAASGDAFAAGGFAVVVARDSFPGLSSGDALRRSGVRIACVAVGSDDWESATATAAALRDAGAQLVVASAESGEAMPASGFDAVVTPRADIVALLSDLLDRIAAAEENGQS